MQQETQHAGTSFMARFVDFDPTADAAIADAGADPAAPAAPAIPAPAVPAFDAAGVGEDGALEDYTFGEEPPEGEPAEEPAAWAGPSQQEWQQVQTGLGALNQLMEYLSTPEPEAAPEPPPSILDNIDQHDLTDPDTFRSAVREEAEKLLEERVGPYQPILDAQAQQQGEQMVRSALDQLAGQIGEFDRDQALLLANSFLANGVQPAQAFEHAARIRFADETRMKQQAVEEYRKQIGDLGDVEPEPAGRGAALESEEFKYDPLDPDKYEKLAQRHLARRAAERARTTG